jgi:hypothetical protein
MVSENKVAEEQLDETPNAGGLMDAVEIEPEPEEIGAQEEEANIPHVAAADGEKEEAPLERPDYLPAKFWSDDDGPDIEKLSKSYTELESKFRAGKHKAPKEYDTSGLTEKGFKTEDPIVEEYIGWAKENKISQAAFEDLAGKIIEISGGQAEQDAYNEKRELEKLGPNATEIIKSNKMWQQGLQAKGILSDTDMEEMNAWGYTSDGQKLIQKMRSLMGERVTVPLSAPEAMGDMTEDDLYDLVKDPRYRSDTSFRRDVEKKFEQFHASR